MSAINSLLLPVLALAGAATALQPLKIAPLSVKTLTESQTARIDFTVEDLNSGAVTTCNTAWVIGNPVIDWYACANNEFTFNFPSGIPDTEEFEMLINHHPSTGSTVIARAVLNSHAGTPVYVCETPGATPGTSEQCDITEGSDVIAQPIYN